MNGRAGQIPACQDPRWPGVRDRARALVRRAHAQRPGWSPPPYDPTIYAEMMGIPVEERAGLRWDALLVPLAGGRFRILVNGNMQSAGRRCFSIAHEIAHTFLPDAAEACRRRSVRRSAFAADPQQAEERLCDQAAAELLMPAEVFAAALCGHGFCASTLPLLAERFEVSLEAAAWRIVDTAPGPCAAGIFRLAPRPTVEQQPEQAAGVDDLRLEYRVRRLFASPGFPYFFPPGRSVPRSSIVYQASLGHAELAAEELFTLGRTSRRLQVSACRLPALADPEAPPLVAAVMWVGAG